MDIREPTSSIGFLPSPPSGVFWLSRCRSSPSSATSSRTHAGCAPTIADRRRIDASICVASNPYAKLTHAAPDTRHRPPIAWVHAALNHGELVPHVMFGIPWETTEIVERGANEHDTLHAGGPNVSYLRHDCQGSVSNVASNLRKFGLARRAQPTSREITRFRRGARRGSGGGGRCRRSRTARRRRCRVAWGRFGRSARLGGWRTLRPRSGPGRPSA